jgi:KUP system potassium uptake protein
VRLPGVAIFLNPNRDTAPLALHGQVEHTHTLHKKVLLVSVDTVSIPHVGDEDRFAVEKLGPRGLNIRHVTIRNGYHDALNIPGLLHECRKQGLLERDLDLEHASYFVSRITITPTAARPLRAWRKGLFIAMARNAASPIDHFGLPSDRTVMMGSQVAV